MDTRRLNSSNPNRDFISLYKEYLLAIDNLEESYIETLRKICETEALHAPNSPRVEIIRKEIIQREKVLNDTRSIDIDKRALINICTSSDFKDAEFNHMRKIARKQFLSRYPNESELLKK